MTDPVSFERDIAPLFAPYRAGMSWRFDLTRYEDVRRFAVMIHRQISSQNMPPPPYPPLTEAQVALFAAWMAQGHPP